MTKDDIFDNRLIFGDTLLPLKELAAGKQRKYPLIPHHVIDESMTLAGLATAWELQP